MLEVRGLWKTFGRGAAGEVQALCGVDLTLAEGEFLIVIGTNGSGKSTLLSAVAGTFAPDQGTILLAGEEVTDRPEHRRAARIGRVFQNPFSGTAPNMTIAENLALSMDRGRPRGLGLLVRRRQREEMRHRLRSLGMGLEDRLDNAVGGLSGGQRQALTLLMATWRRPDLLLLDEHTAALDPKSAEQVIRLTGQVVAEQHLTALMVTHSMRQAAGLGDRLIMMHKGRVIHRADGVEKRRLRPADLLALFEEVRAGDRLDQAAAELLRGRYV